MTLRSLNLFAAIAFAGIIGTGCSSTAHVEKDSSADFTRYKTYSWIENSKTEFKGSKAQQELAAQNMRNAVNKQLQKNGWTEVSSNPDLLVSSDILVEKNVRPEREAVYSQPTTRTFYNPYTRRYSTYYIPSQFLGYDSYERAVNEGTVTVTLIDRKTDKAVWQGWSTDELNRKNITSKEIDQNVKSIFKKFDAGK